MASAATTSGDSTPEETSTKTVATFVPGKGLKGYRREITKKDAKAIEVDLQSDLVWEHANGHRVDVTDVPEALLAVLKEDPDFKISNES